MSQVIVHIKGKDRRVGAMVKALAVEVSGFRAVKGTTKDFLQQNGYYQFNFPSNIKSKDFISSVNKYLSDLTQIEDD